MSLRAQGPDFTMTSVSAVPGPGSPRSREVPAGGEKGRGLFRNRERRASMRDQRHEPPLRDMTDPAPHSFGEIQAFLRHLNVDP